MICLVRWCLEIASKILKAILQKWWGGGGFRRMPSIGHRLVPTLRHIASDGTAVAITIMFANSVATLTIRWPVPLAQEKHLAIAWCHVAKASQHLLAIAHLKRSVLKTFRGTYRAILAQTFQSCPNPLGTPHHRPDLDPLAIAMNVVENVENAADWIYRDWLWVNPKCACAMGRRSRFRLRWLVQADAGDKCFSLQCLSLMVGYGSIPMALLRLFQDIFKQSISQ